MMPLLSLSIFSVSISTQVTFVPISAKQVPVTKPTYPVPTIATFIIGNLFLVIHILITPLILPRGHVIDPLLVIEIPSDCFFDAFFELEGRFPAQFLLELRGVDRIAQVVPGSVSDIGNQFFARAFRPAQQSIYGLDDRLLSGLCSSTR